jgi:predicted peptidase
MIMSGGDSRLRALREAYGFTEPTFNEDGSIADAGSFVPAAEGELTYVTPTNAASENALPEVVKTAIADRTARYDKIGEDATVTYYGNSAPNRICLGDLQKSVRHILGNALISQDMVKLYADLLDKEITVTPISEYRDAPIASGYKQAEKSEVKNIGIIADKVTVDTMNDTAAQVNVEYKGEDALTTVRLTIDSALPIASIDSVNDFEYNPANGEIVVYNSYGTDISNPLFVINYEFDSLIADGEYPIALSLIEATKDSVKTDAVTVDGAIIVDNVFAKGDVTMDGELDNRDLIMIARYLVELVDFNAKQKELADFDEDGDIDNVDLVLIARAIVSMYGTPYSNEARGTYAYVVNGYDWGGAVTKVILDVTKPIDADSIDASDFNVAVTSQGFGRPSTSNRTVTDAYASDVDGNKVEEASRYIAIEMYVDPNNGGAFYYNFCGSSHNEWPNPYTNAITLTEGATLTSAGKEIDTLTININATKVISPLSDQFVQNYFTSSEGIDLAYGAWAPAEDNAKNPLIIWLHGAGEGGTDNRIVTMGNKVENLITDEIQQYFRTEDISGAYVLTPQSPDMWMNDGTGSYTSDGTSMYTEALMELIQSYVDATPDIDTNRIYIGGCSNGGFMTMNMLIHYPTYFAAAYPVCEAYTDSWITDEQIETIKNIPIWFTQAQNDGTVNPQAHTVATYARLQEAGAKDVYFSFFEDVHDTTGHNQNNKGEPYQYNGHWSWIYTLNNECVKEDGTTIMQWMAAQSK